MSLIKTKKYHHDQAFTLVEIIIVVAVIAILAVLAIVGFGAWRTRVAETEVKNDLSNLQASMEDARNRTNGYPVFSEGATFDGTNNDTKKIFTSSKNVRITYNKGTDKFYCIDIQSKVVPSVGWFIDSSTGNATPTQGTCDGGAGSSPPAPNETIFVFDTTAPGCTGTVQLPISSPSSGGSIDWGDGATQSRTSSLQSHTYSTGGTYRVTYTGPINQASYYSSVDTTNAKCLKRVSQWATGLSLTRVSFYNASNLTYVADLPTTVTDTSFMFMGATSFNQAIGSWNTGNITNMEAMFAGATSFNQAIGSWNTAAVTNMNGIFSDANIFNQSINNWNVANVTGFSHSFHRAYAFNQPLDNWNVSKVTDMYGMFYHATSFNQPINSWNTSNVLTMANMFNDTPAFNQPLNSWNTAKVTDMNGMFSGSNNFNQPINSWNVANVEGMGGMFSNAYSFNQPLGSWNTSKVRYFDWMFNYSSFNQNIAGWNTSSLVDKTAFHANSPLTQANCPAALW